MNATLTFAIENRDWEAVEELVKVEVDHFSGAPTLTKQELDVLVTEAAKDGFDLKV